MSAKLHASQFLWAVELSEFEAKDLLNQNLKTISGSKIEFSTVKIFRDDLVNHGRFTYDLTTIRQENNSIYYITMKYLGRPKDLVQIKISELRKKFAENDIHGHVYDARAYRSLKNREKDSFEELAVENKKLKDELSENVHLKAKLEGYKEEIEKLQAKLVLTDDVTKTNDQLVTELHDLKVQVREMSIRHLQEKIQMNEYVNDLITKNTNAVKSLLEINYRHNTFIVNNLNTVLNLNSTDLTREKIQQKQQELENYYCYKSLPVIQGIDKKRIEEIYEPVNDEIRARIESSATALNDSLEYVKTKVVDEDNRQKEGNSKPI